RELVAYWLHGYDWREEERRLNQLNQYTVAIAGIDLHLVLEPGVGPDPRPLLLLHGWPGSFFEFSRLIPRLADPGRFGGDPADAFTVVAPSLPGYTFSHQPFQPRLDAVAMADAFAELMTEVLGHRRFVAAGSDWGARITTRLGHAHAGAVSGVYLTTLPVRREATLPAQATPEQRRYAERIQEWEREEQGYTVIQGTRPQTLAYALTDSPVGLLAWILEKLRAWSDCGGDVERRFSRDDILTWVSLYWFSGGIGSSFWLYHGRRHGMWSLADVLDAGGRLEVPTGFVELPGEIIRTPRALVEAAVDLRHWTTLPSGGHFAAFEEPDLIAADLRDFARGLDRD
ncbi:MAG: epoxide hydrolase, partial [Chloroflexi bacterium]